MSDPAEDELDEPKVQYWDLIQAVVWIWKRDESAAISVRERRGGKGRRLESWYSEPGFKTGLEQLWDAIQQGKVIGRGAERPGLWDHLVPIAALEWGGLEIADGPYGIEVSQRGHKATRGALLNNPGTVPVEQLVKQHAARLPRAYLLRFSKAEIMREWRAAGGPLPEPPKKGGPRDKRDRVRAFLKKRYPPTGDPGQVKKIALLAEITDEIGKVGIDTVKRAIIDLRAGK